MKKVNLLFAFMAVFPLVFTSCSSDEIDSPQSQEKVALTFNAKVNDLANRAGLKQAISEIPQCSGEDVVYVEIILSRDGNPVVGNVGNPFRVDLVPGRDFTEEVPELELVPGNYSLDYFAVFDAQNNAVWVAPVTGSEMANLVTSALPLSIDLGAGVKKYVDVPVLCFDDRMVNQYGYLFFELIPSQAIEWCIFGNYCDETGRHFPAQYSINIWDYENGQRGQALYTNLTNTVELNDAGDYAASPLCVALPDGTGLDEYYVEITLLNSDAYGTLTERVIREGVINDTDVRNLFSGDSAVDYYHFREGCGSDDSPELLEITTTFFGDVLEIGGGTAQTLVRLNSNGDLRAVGVRISEEVLDGLQNNFEHYTLQFPEEAEGMIFDHFDLEWNPTGHEPPGVYDIPHFDMHFYMISEADKMAITDPALADVLPAPQFWPETYVPIPGFVPMMGKHWVSTEAGELQGETFGQTFIFGSYNGNFIFYEPMITIDYLRNQPNEQFNIFQPSVFQKTGYYYPTTYSIRYNEGSNEYLIILENMVLR